MYSLLASTIIKQANVFYLLSIKETAKNPNLMKINLRILLLCLFACVLVSNAMFAQGNPKPTNKTEASDPDDVDTPLDGVYERTTIAEKRILPYDHIREADVFWEKRIWRVIDVREKINLPFTYPKRPFITILMDAAEKGDITLYSVLDDEFKNPLTADEAASIGASVDTIITFDPETFKEEIKVVRNELDYSNIKRFRVKEVWFFDEETSTMQVRILGIAPLQEVYDDNDNFRYEQPLFWAYYPDMRNVLAKEPAFNVQNDAARMSWEDIFEMRFFASYIYKQSNVYDKRIQDYKTGVDIILEAERIKESIFEFEHDLWSF